MRRIIALGAAALLAVPMFPAPAGATPRVSGVAWAINNLGDAVGASTVHSGDTHATQWSGNGYPSSLGTLGGASSWAYGINDRGTVVGESETATGERRAFLRREDGSMTELPALPGAAACAALDVNDLDDAVGYCEVAAELRAVVWSGGEVAELELARAGGVAYGLNERGEILAQCEPNHVLVVWQGPGYPGVGTPWMNNCYQRRIDTSNWYPRKAHFGDINNAGEAAVNIGDNATLWSRGDDGDLHPVDLGSAEVFDLNERGDAVGRAGGPRLWSAGTTTDLGTLGGIGAGTAYGVNDRGQVVGDAQRADGGWRAFRWTNGRMVELMALADMQY